MPVKLVSRRIWQGALRWLALIALLSALLAAFWGVSYALAFALAGVLALLIYHLWHLNRLARLSAGEQVPPSWGTRGPWRDVFERLQRRERHAHELRAHLSVQLERFRAASNAMPDGLIYLAGMDTIEWLNHAAEEHFGLDHVSDLTQPLSALVRDPALAQLLEATEHDEPLIVTSPRRPAMRLLLQLVAFGDGQKLLVSRDVTQLEKLETMRKDFIANVSHELRTPLTVVSGFVETVMDSRDELPAEDVDRYLNLALEQSTRMQRLIEDLLTLSALETGAPAPAEERTDVIAMVRAVHQEAELLSANKHNVTLFIQPGTESDYVIGSQKELHSAFANLAINAVRYTPEGGHVRIAWKQVPGGREFAVEDDGIGIDAHHLARLTERFFRVDRGRSRETGGTGLGLAIVKHIVSRHQAELRIDSEKGRGSRFSVFFPDARLMQRGR